MVHNPKLSDTIEINQVEDGYVLYQTDLDKVHYLNPTAVLVLESCNGNNSLDEIVGIVQDVFQLSEPPAPDVTDCLETMLREGIVV